MTCASFRSSHCGASVAYRSLRPAMRRSNSRGGRYPRLLCGRSSLYSSLHAAIFLRAFKQIPEPTRVQAFVPQLPAEAFHKRILHRPPRLNMHQLDLPLQRPRQKTPARKLRPVVAANRFRRSALRHNLPQIPRHSPTRKSAIRFQRQTFSRVHVDHAQHAKLPSALRRIMHKIQCPLLGRSRHHRSRNTRSPQPFSPLPPDQQPRFPVHAIHFLVVHVQAFFFQLQLQAPVSPLRLLPRRFQQARAQLFVVPPARIPLARLRHVQQLADPPLAHQKLAPQPAHFLLAFYELHPFFSITAFSISLSRLKSATSFFSRPFSSSSCRSRCASPTVIPPYLAFHA